MENKKKIALLTGATGGLGYAFLQELIKEPPDEIWALGRNLEKLESLCAEFGDIIKPVCCDLTETSQLQAIAAMLEEQKPQIDYLINNAGAGKMQASADCGISEIEAEINLNCKAPAILTNLCLPYMDKGGKILNICSAAAFQPVPYLNLYASEKAFLRSYSRAMNAELKPLGITVTAVCPGWIDTGMLVKILNGKKVKFGGMVTPQRVAKKAVKDAKKGKDTSVCSLYVKCLHFNVKLLPQKLTMKIWLKSIKKYL